MCCRICGNSAGLSSYSIREMMYGIGQSFEYIQCAQCGCLQIRDTPPDLNRWYPKGYYSLQEISPAPSLRRAVRDFVLRSAVTASPKALSCLARRRYPTWRLIGLCCKNKEAALLDVGCGNGSLVRRLRNWGYRNTYGIDPFLENDVLDHEGEVMLRKQSLGEHRREYDAIMFHHSFEHMPDPLETLRAARRLLRPGGCCLIRIPIVSSWAWEKYRECWVQADAPRHLYLHSETSFNLVASSAGFKVDQVIYDSDEFQIWASEQYVAGVPLLQSLNGSGRPLGLSRGKLRAYRRFAQRLNAIGRGDQAGFLLFPAP